MVVSFSNRFSSGGGISVFARALGLDLDDSMSLLDSPNRPSNCGIFELQSTSVYPDGQDAMGSAARLGRLAVAGRKVVETPGFLAITSRGVIPHLTPDVVSEHTQVGGVHLALEDCKEHKVL